MKKIKKILLLMMILCTLIPVKEVGATDVTQEIFGEVFIEKTHLSNYIHEAYRMMRPFGFSYTEESLANLVEAVEYAEAVYDDVNATLEDVLDAEKAIKDAIDNLEISKVNPSTPHVNVWEVYEDVKHDSWYADSVQYVYDKGLMSGNGAYFNPTADITRAQLVTTLYRLAGKPEVTDTSALTDFTDVVDGKYYSDAVCWAYVNGIATGNNGKFDPTGKLTRQQLSTFFYRFSQVMGCNTEASVGYSDMLNADKVSEYAKDAVAWAVGSGLISGSEKVVDGVKVYDLNPRGNTTRAQVATILMRFCESYGEV